jgi:hypothetical protein
MGVAQDTAELLRAAVRAYHEACAVARQLRGSSDFMARIRADDAEWAAWLGYEQARGCHALAQRLQQGGA